MSCLEFKGTRGGEGTSHSRNPKRKKKGFLTICQALLEGGGDSEWYKKPLSSSVKHKG